MTLKQAELDNLLDGRPRINKQILQRFCDNPNGLSPSYFSFIWTPPTNEQAFLSEIERYVQAFKEHMEAKNQEIGGDDYPDVLNAFFDADELKDLNVPTTALKRMDQLFEDQISFASKPLPKNRVDEQQKAAGVGKTLGFLHEYLSPKEPRATPHPDM